jgi:PAS domain S-box-containing protein
MRKFLQKMRLPHRINLILILGILIPMTMVISLSSWRLENELKDNSSQRMRFEAKNTAMSIMERLKQLESEMFSFVHNNASAVKNMHSSLHVNNSHHRESHFSHLIYWGSRGYEQRLGDDLTSMIGQLNALTLMPSKKTQLIEYNVTGKATQLIMAITLSDSEWLLGLIDTQYLLNEESHFNLPLYTEICFLDSADTIIASTIPESANLIKSLVKAEEHRHASTFTWDNGDDTYLASAYEIFIESHFSGRPLTVVLTRPEKSIIRPVETLKRNIMLTGLLVLFAVLLLCSISIRRSLGPLNQLIVFAKRLGEGDFSKKASVDGSPEVKELSLTFNTMSGRMERYLSQIRESEERFRTTFEESPAGIALVNAEGRFLMVNEALIKFLRHPEEVLLTKSLYDVLHPEELAKGNTREVGISDFGTIGDAEEKRFISGEEKIVIGLLSVSALEKSTRAEATHIVHIQDITDQKAAQIEFRKLEAQYYHAQKMEAIGTLAAGISHDFNNILSVIIGNAELALMDVRGGTNAHKDLKSILKAGRQAAELTKQILSFSRSGDGEFAPMQLSVIVKEALKMLRSSIPKHISIVNKISNERCLVNANSTQMHQLILNLCTNSYHAMMDKSAGTLEVSLIPERIRLPQDQEAKAYLKLQIADTGCGMAPEIMERIFDPYFTTKPKGKGTGLGLSIVHSIVEKHRGTISVESEPGCGTTFTIHLPMIDNVVESKTQIQTRIPSGHESILIVDDERDISMTWQQMLNRQGYAVTVKNHPYLALEELKNDPERYSLILTDLCMPDMTGDKLSEEIYKINPRVPIILCTGYFEETLTKTLCSAVKHNLSKPVDLVTLAVTVRSVIDQLDARHLQPGN